MFDQIALLFSSVLELTSVFDGNHCVSLILPVVPRRGLQQCYNNISVFITRLTCVHVVPAHQTPSTAPPPPCEYHPAQRLSITLVER